MYMGWGLRGQGKEAKYNRVGYGFTEVCGKF